MSKRIADEYITKEHGSTSNISDDRAPKMATAAQLAKRKLAAPKSRLGRAGTPGATSPALDAPNPFASSGFSQQPSFQASGNDIFGANKSFPPTNGAANSGFSFSVPGISSSFTFGQSFPAPAANPFESLNGSKSQDVPPTSNGVGSEDTMMESPQKKPVFGGFGSGSSTTGANIFAGFGAQSTQGSQQSSFGMSQPQTNGFASDSSKSVFGQPLNNQSSSAPAASLFGQTLQTQSPTPLFGVANTGSSQTAVSSPSFSFGSNAAATASQTPSFSFGQTQAPASPQPSPTPLSFGQTPQSTAGSDTDSSKPPPSDPNRPLFGSAMPHSSNTASTPLFGSAPQSLAPSNLFASFGSQPSTTAKADTPSSQAPSATNTNPFASLLGSTPRPAAEALAAAPPKPLFSFSAPSQPSGLFGAESENVGATKDTQTPSASDSLFKFPTSASQSSPSDTTSGTKNSNSLANGSVLSSENTPGSSGKGLFGINGGSSKSFSFGSTPAPQATSQPSNLFGAAGKVSTSSTPFSATTPKTDLSTIQVNQSSSRPSLSGPAKSHFGASSSSSEPKVGASSNAPQSDQNTEDAPKRTVYSNPPARVPAWLNGDKYKSYDSNYRLHSLNREFQKRIASLNPAITDFENVIRSYVAARESIGESVGLYTRNIAGMKRKVDDASERSDESQGTKRARQAEEPVQTTQTTKSPPMSSIFQPVPSAPSSKNGNLFASLGKTASSSKSESNTSSVFKSLLPNGQTSSATNSQAPATGFSIGNPSSFTGVSKGTSSLPAANSTTPPSSPPKKDTPAATGFKPAMTGFKPMIAAPAAGTDFLSAFSRSAQASSNKFAKAAREKRMAEDFDSDEDDLETWTKQYEEEEKAKRAKIASASAQGFKPTFGSTTPSTGGSLFGSKSTTENHDLENDAGDEQETGSETNDGNSSENGGEELREDEGEYQEDEDAEVDEEAEETIRLPPGKSLFDRITKDDSPPKGTTSSPSKKTSTPVFSFGASTSTTNIAKSTPEAPAFSPITPVTGTPFVPSTTFNFTPAPKDQPSPTPGASVFSGGIIREGPIPGEGLFGSRSGTPVNGDKSASTSFAALGASTSTPAADHTWKKGSEIKFGMSTTDAPPVNITAATPPSAKPFGSLFGATPLAANSSATPSTLGFSFGNTSSTPAHGFLGASSHLLPGSGISSAMSSRATSPGATDNESVATDTEDAANDPQASFTHTRPGEENEEVLFEVRAKALKAHTEEEVKGTKKQSPWNTEGTGEMRLLKNKETGKTRVVLRTDPGANIVINTNLMSDIKYASRAVGTNGAVQFPIFKGTDKPEKWLIKVKTPAIANELASVMEANKGS